jgi:hypothetical protein
MQEAQYCNGTWRIGWREAWAEAVLFVRVDVMVWAGRLDGLRERIGKRVTGRAALWALANLERLLAGLELRNGQATTGRACR